MDENLPHPFRNSLAGHESFTAKFMGWDGISNGELIALAARNGFDALVTLDQNIEHHVEPDHLPISIVILHAQSSSMRHLVSLAPRLLQALDSMRPGTLVHVR